jgi:hypothetical protein
MALGINPRNSSTPVSKLDTYFNSRPTCDGSHMRMATELRQFCERNENSKPQTDAVKGLYVLPGYNLLWEVVKEGMDKPWKRPGSNQFQHCKHVW